MLRDRQLNFKRTLVFGVSRYSVWQKKTCDAFGLIGIDRVGVHWSLDSATYTAILVR
jgi:hypothetical protein